MSFLPPSAESMAAARREIDIVGPPVEKGYAQESADRCSEFALAIARAGGKLLVSEAEYRQVLAEMLHRSLSNVLRVERYADPETEQEGRS